MEQLNIEGKRSGQGFVAHKAMLVNALSRATADRVIVNDVTLGRKGLLGYLRALGGSNTVKVTPSNGEASGVRLTDKGLKVICGANTSYLAEGNWIGDKTPLTFCQVRICPANTVKPNLGAAELSEALAKVIPFAATEENRPVLQCVKFEAGGGKLRLVSADGFRLAILDIDFDGEGQALIEAQELKGIVSTLKRARRARVDIEDSQLIIDTELIRYKWVGFEGQFPDYEKLIPTEANCQAHLDTVEALKAVNTLKALGDGKGYQIDIIISDGKIAMADHDGKGQVELSASTEGQGRIRLNGQYLAEALRACGGMIDFKLSDSNSPTLFTANGYKLVVMPIMIKPEAVAQQADQVTEAVAEAEEMAEDMAEVEAVAQEMAEDMAEADQVTEAVAEAEAVAQQADQVAEAVAEAEAVAQQADQVTEAKPKRKGRAREALAVA